MFFYNLNYLNKLKKGCGIRVQIITDLQEHFEEMVAIRRYLHERPELSFQEVHTPKYIANYYKDLGIEVREQVGGRGVVAKLRTGKQGRTIALRADFDALAIQELNDIPYKSKNDGVMHACGHDGHTATLLVLAKVLNQYKEQLSGTIVFIHQHAEELAPGGAIAMIEDGCLDGVDEIYGAHLWAPLSLGTVQYLAGPIMAAADRFEIAIQGKGGHGAEPHETVDAIVVASQFITQLQTIVARTIDPLQSAVVSVGHFEANNPFNVIADRVNLLGTVRTFSQEVRETVKNRIEQYLQGVCISYGATYEYQYIDGYPPVINHDEQTNYVKEVALSNNFIPKVEECSPMMIGEDFAYYLQHVPGSFFFVGAKDCKVDQQYPHHHAKFNFDEKAMLYAAEVFCGILLKRLKLSEYF